MKTGLKYVFLILIISFIWAIIFGHNQIYGTSTMVYDAPVPQIDYLNILMLLLVVLTFVFINLSNYTNHFLLFILIIFAASFLFKEPINIKNAPDAAMCVVGEYSMFGYIIRNPITFACYLIGHQLRYSSLACIIMIIIKNIYFKITKVKKQKVT